MNRLLSTHLVSFLLLILSLVACQDFKGNENIDPSPLPDDRCTPTDINQVDEVMIGATVPLSTPGSAASGEVMQVAFNIAVSDINAAGGILGKPVRLIIKDTAGLPEMGTTVAKELITADCVVAIVGEYHSAVALTINEVAHDYHIPVIFAETYSDEITAKGYPETFRIAPTSTFTAQMDAKWLAEAGDYNGDGKLFAVVVAENTDYGAGQIEKARTWFPEFGIELAVVNIDVPSEEFEAAIAEIKGLNRTPDAIFIKVTGESSYHLQQQMTDAGLGPNVETIMVANQVALDHETYWQNVPDGAFAVVPRIGPWSSIATEAGLEFAEKYSKTFERWPEAYAFEAYDSLMLMANAIERAGSLDTDAIIVALEKTDLKLTAGHYTFPYGSQNPAGGYVADFMWHQWADVPLLFLQYTAANQHPDEMEVIWPEGYRTTDQVIIRPD